MFKPMLFGATFVSYCTLYISDTCTIFVLYPAERDRWLPSELMIWIPFTLLSLMKLFPRVRLCVCVCECVMCVRVRAWVCVFSVVYVWYVVSLSCFFLLALYCAGV